MLGGKCAVAGESVELPLSLSLMCRIVSCMGSVFFGGTERDPKDPVASSLLHQSAEGYGGIVAYLFDPSRQ